MLFLLSVQAIAQEVKPYYYNNKLIFKDKPISVKEYGYDYDTKEEKEMKNHTLTYTPQGKIATHTESNEGISTWFQTFRYRFSYDAAGRLIYYWSEQYSSFNNTFTSQWEEQWVYDDFGMLVEYNNWSVSSGTKYIGADSWKRKITREQGSNRVLTTATRKYSTFNKDFELSDSLEFKYKAGKLDTLRFYKSNATWGGRMDLDETRYNLDLRVENYTNTDSIKYNSFTYDDWYPTTRTREFGYDASGRLISDITKSQDGTKESEVAITYETGKVTTINNGTEKTVSYIDQTGLEYKREVYSWSNGSWSLGSPYYWLKTRTFAENKLSEELVQSYSASTSTYEKESRFVYTYENSLGLSEEAKRLDVSVAPNPTTGNIVIRNSEKLSAISLIKMDGTSRTIAVSPSVLLDENPGCYLLRLTGNEGSHADYKIVITK